VNESEHRELREMLGALLLGELSPDEAALVRNHLEICAECRAEHDLLVPVSRELALLGPLAAGTADQVPADLGHRVTTAVAAERSTRRRGRLAFARHCGGTAVRRRRGSSARMVERFR